MTKEKLKLVLQGYSKLFILPPVPLSKAEYAQRSVHRTTARCGHIMWMCRRAQELMDEGRIEKANRWLGFIQGWLWAQGLRSLDQLKQESKSDKPVCPHCARRE